MLFLLRFSGQPTSIILPGTVTSSLNNWDSSWLGHSFQPAVGNLLVELQKHRATDYNWQMFFKNYLVLHNPAISPLEVKGSCLGAADVIQASSGRVGSTNLEMCCAGPENVRERGWGCGCGQG